MKLRRAIKDHWAEQRLFNSRLLISLCVATLMTFGLITRLVILQVVEFQKYEDLSRGNRLRLEALPPTRGIITDRNNVILADNRPRFQLELVRERVQDVDNMLQRLAEEAFIEQDDIPSLLKIIKNENRPFVAIPLRYRLSEEEVARFAAMRPHFTGVDIAARLIRHYPHAELTAHAVGYVGRINPTEQASLDETRYAATQYIGKTGIEYAFENYLHGYVGYESVLVNAEGRPLRRLQQDAATPGGNIQLTLDFSLQHIAYEVMQGQSGAVLAMDPNTGAILVWLSMPSFNPNWFVRGITQKELDGLYDNIEKPLFNRPMQGLYPPASTIKPMLGLAALNQQLRISRKPLFCTGEYRLPGGTHRYRDWKPEGHRWMSLESAIEESCDVYFYELARELDIDELSLFLGHFGFGQTVGIELAGEKAGTLPSRAWKRSVFQKREQQTWFPGETIIAGIGQGYFQTSPLQLLSATGQLANRGALAVPHINKANAQPINNTRFLETDIDPAYWQRIHQAMIDVVHGNKGTARGIGYGLDYQIAGKTGTAQVYSIGQEDTYDKEDTARHLRNHGLFIGYAPAAAPNIAVAVIIEHGGGGSSSAAPVAKAIIDAHVQAQRDSTS